MAYKISIYNSTLKADPDKQNAWKRRSKPMNKASKKRKSERPRVERWEQAVFERDNYKCQNPDCESHPDYFVFDAHHIWPKGSNPKWKFFLENGITLCRVCHGKAQRHELDLSACGIDSDALKQEFMRDVGTIIE